MDELDVHLPGVFPWQFDDQESFPGHQSGQLAATRIGALGGLVCMRRAGISGTARSTWHLRPGLPGLASTTTHRPAAPDMPPEFPHPGCA